MGILRHPLGRHGSALLLTMIVVVAVAGLTAFSSDRMSAQTKLEKLNLFKQQAVYAAEAGAAMAESFLKANATDLASLSIDLNNTTSHPPATWFNFMGQAVAGSPPMFVGDCMVRWRLEPVRISGVTFDGNAPGSGATLVNDQVNTTVLPPSGVVPNPGLYHFRIVADAYVLNHEYLQEQGIQTRNATPWNDILQARCKAQAQRVDQFYVTNLFRYVIFYAANGPTGDLEIHPGPALNIAGAVHSNGTIYAGGNGTYATDFRNGCKQGGQVTIGSTANKVTITGVNGILRTCKGAMHSMVNNRLNAGIADAANYLVRPNDIPMPGDSKYSVTMTGIYDLNGDMQTFNSDRVLMNGNRLTYLEDTRSSLTVGGSDAYVRDGPNRQANPVQTLANLPEMSGYPYEPQALGAADDSRLGRSPGNGFGRILPGTGMTRFGGVTLPVSDINGNQAYTADMPLFLMQNAAGNVEQDVWPRQMGGGVFNADNATDLDDATRPWVHEPGENGLPWVFAPITGSDLEDYDATGADTAGTYLPELFSERWMVLNPTAYTWTVPQSNGIVGRAKPNYYLDVSLFGQPGRNMTGLTIRERGRQNTEWQWRRDNPGGGGNGDDGLTDVDTGPLPPAPNNNTNGYWTGGGAFDAALTNVNYARRYAAWLKSQYVVYLGTAQAGGVGNIHPVDITDAFFDFNIATGDIRQLVATHDEFLDTREADYFRLARYNTDATRRRTVLTLNLAAIQQFLSPPAPTPVGRRLQDLSSAFAGNANPAKTIFSGLIYVQRTPRHINDGGVWVHDCLQPRSYHPIANPTPALPPAAEFPTPAAGNKYYPVVGWVGRYRGPAFGPDGARLGLSLPPVSTIPQYPAWAVYPTTKAVRIRNGAVINWGRDQGGVTPARLEGLTICTPDPLYLWGNYNTTVDRGNYPPCAILADSVSVLSNNWTFAQDLAGGTPAAVSTTYRVSYAINNMPTDLDNISRDASGGVHNAIRYLENWGGQTYTFIGSLVVMNRSRYSRGYVSGYYGAPTRNLQFNSDLLTMPGIPPETPKGVQVTRVVSTINLINR